MVRLLPSLTRLRVATAAIAGLLACSASLALRGAGIPAEPIVLKANGGWCWFQDERAVVSGGSLFFGTVSGCDRAGAQAGDVAVTQVELRGGKAQSATLHARFQCDDHDVPALLELPDGRLLATYQSHGGKGFAGVDLMRWRRTVRPHDISEWTPEQTLPVGASVSYSNPFRLSGEGGRVLLFHRGVGFNPNYLVSTDDGATFSYGGRLLNWPLRPKDDPRYTGIGGGRPYLKYAQQGEDTIHFVATEDHPSSYDNSLYHAYIKGGMIHHSDGRVIGPLSRTRETEVRPTDLTRIYPGGIDQVAWMCDLHLDQDGRPRVVFSVQRGGAAGRGKRPAINDGMDLRYHYARWDGKAWREREIAMAGTRLYAGEDDYAGLAAIDPQDANTIYISTNSDPKTGAPLVSAADGRRHWEIYRGTSADNGETWSWSAITRDSRADNLRPIVPMWADARGRAILLWLRGTYRSYTDYDLDVVGVLPKG